MASSFVYLRHRHFLDTFLNGGDPGHPLFTGLPIAAWIACELTRAYLIPGAMAGESSAAIYTDDATPGLQRKLRRSDPSAYIDGLCPPLRAAVALAIDIIHDGSHPMERWQTGRTWIGQLCDRRSRHGPLDPVSYELRSELLAGCVRRIGTPQPMSADLLREIHLWDAHRVVLGPAQEVCDINTITGRGPQVAAPEAWPIPLACPEQFRTDARSVWSYHAVTWRALRLYSASEDRERIRQAEAVWQTQTNPLANPGLEAKLVEAGDRCEWARMLRLPLDNIAVDQIVTRYLYSRERLSSFSPGGRPPLPIQDGQIPNLGKKPRGHRERD